MVTYLKSYILPAFYFFNHCLNGRLYPRRPLLRKDPRYHYQRCKLCGQSTINNDRICYHCRAVLNEIRDYREREKLMLRSMKRADQFSETLKTCKKRGVCDILSAHHTFLGNDPDRLTTEFMVKMICRKDYVPGSKTREVVLGDDE